MAVSTDGQYDRAISYAHKALEIAKAQKEQKDTLLANWLSPNMLRSQEERLFP